MELIILQFINVSNRQFVHLKLTKCCMSVISQFKKKRKYSSYWEGAKDNGRARMLATFFFVGGATSEIYIYPHQQLVSGRVRI